MKEETLIECGGLTAIWQKQDTFLRSITLNGEELLRGIYVALRDENWGTVPAKLSNYETEERTDGFFIRSSIQWHADTIDFRGQIIIEGSPDGNISYLFQGTAHSEFESNRIGFLVLHPAEVAGKEVTVEQVDGNLVNSRFPAMISPHQPFFDIRAITHQAGPFKVTTRMEGDVYEMEDQRNWTDASFKTYCTPLALPFPRTYRPGDKVEQKISVTVNGRISESYRAEDRIRLETAKGKRHDMPKIGFAIPENHSGSFPANIQSQIKALAPDHLRVDIRMSRSDWQERLQSAGQLAGNAGVALEIAAFCSDNAEDQWRQLVDAVATSGFDVARWLVFHEQELTTSEKWISIARKCIRESYSRPAPIVTGTDAFFTEINRKRPAGTGHDAVCFSLNPQYHAFDNRSMIETLSIQGICAKNAAEFTGKPICVSPVSMKMRWNPYATGDSALTEDQRYDARMKEPFGVVWTLGSLKYLAEAGVKTITFYETHGINGIFDTSENSPDPAIGSDLSTLVSLFHEVLQHKEAEVIPCTTTSKEEVVALHLQEDDHRILIMANLTDEPKVVETVIEGNRGEYTLTEYSVMRI